MLLKLVDLFAFLSVVLRAGTLVFQSLLLGGVLFVLWVARSSPLAAPESIARIQKSSWNLLRLSAVGLAVVQLLYLYVNSAVLMATAEIGFDGVVGANFFISGCIVLTAALMTAVVASGNKNIAKWALPILAVIVMGASVMTNHAASRLTGRPLLITLSSVHELATGFWIGGLPFLVLALYRAKDPTTQWYVTERFSRLALICVGFLVLSGTIMSVLYIGSWSAVLGTAYGVMVLAKATMLGALLILGGVNFLLLRNTTREHALARLRRLIEAEVGIGITVILTAASLTSQPPAVDQVSETVSLQQIYQRFKPRMPRLTYEYVTEAANAGPEANGVAPTAKPGTYNIDGLPLTTRLINNSIESESNHHWMGLVVLAMGLLALLARTGKAPWAEYWPLLLIGIAIFIFLQADTECWPVGWKSFGACWADPEVFQHRMAALVCVGFAVFELRVRQQKRAGGGMALVFPLMCAIGGAVLLTHQHAISNVKENLLVELSHVPMGVIAVFAGWARWLELRLPEENRAIPSWIWPFCFVLIGVGLLNYREM
ncbi:MAG: CopD family protein [Candidatus Korobacteraceae bacterium]